MFRLRNLSGDLNQNDGHRDPPRESRTNDWFNSKGSRDRWCQWVNNEPGIKRLPVRSKKRNPDLEKGFGVGEWDPELSTGLREIQGGVVRLKTRFGSPQYSQRYNVGRSDIRTMDRTLIRSNLENYNYNRTNLIKTNKVRNPVISKRKTSGMRYQYNQGSGSRRKRVEVGNVPILLPRLPSIKIRVSLHGNVLQFYDNVKCL